ncbi:potassium/proton antiporter [Metabacillus fastidiosus]|uniref:potassium/proton antiporter n=1 Tax=Metabacillus fastidiosus TaxID=1458 RepID=UPI002E1B314C|nr:potassium/proton antiporter [Metabacillus fastidiosus]MED4531096.1 potassium/proton antiporter [Metabacillus fastidiosus]
MITENINIDYFIVLLGIFLILGVVTTKLSLKFGVPALVLFMLIGMLMGSDGVGFIYFDDPHLAELIGIIALIIILFDGGMQTRWSTVKKVAAPSLTLATVGVLLTTSIIAFGAKWILNIDWLEAFLIGAIVGSTDAAAIFSVMTGQNIKDKLSSTLEAESGTNDPMAVFLTVSIIQLIASDNTNIFMLIGSFIWQMGLGLGIGLSLGFIASKLINHINLDSGGLYPVLVLSFAILTYSLSSLINASGLLAVYVAALFIGNRQLTYRHSIIRFNEGLAWMMQIVMFIILGLFASPPQIMNWDIIWKGLLLSIILMFIARPIAVFLCTAFFKFTINDKIFISWAGLRGAVPIVLATFPMIAGIENSQLMFNIIFFVVLTSALIQGSSISFLAEKLRLTGEVKASSPYTMKFVSIGKANAEMIEFEVGNDNHIIGKPLDQISFPEQALINAIIRNNELVSPHSDTIIHEGDTLYILTDKKATTTLLSILNERKEYEQFVSATSE